MQKLALFLIILFSFISVFSQNNKKQLTIDNNKKKLIYVLEIKDEIGPPTWRKMQKAFGEAKTLKSDAIIIHMNTYGGLVDNADSMRTKVLYFPIPVHVFIDNNAASAGALISIACDSIYMRPGASIGASTVVTQDGSAAPDKYQSYMRSTMRATAEAQGRNPNIAEAMVDERISIPGITDSGKVLTLTSTEAMKHGFCQGEANSINEVIKKLGINNYKIVTYTPTLIESIIGFLINPFVSGILIMLIIGGIYFELQAPGIGLPLGVAILGAVLYFFPLYVEGLTQNWEILVFIVGLILIGIEIFVIPGFGITGISGIILVLIGLIISLLPNDGFDFSNVPTNKLTVAMLVALISLPSGIILSFYIAGKAFKSDKLNSLILDISETKEDGFSTANKKEIGLINMTGIAYTNLRPSGKVLVEGDIYDAKSESGFIEKDCEIIVKNYENNQLYVRKI